jgi:vacuolar protein sorting-associated protein 13A/C
LTANESDEVRVLQPISFKLSVQRNLSSAWFTDVPDLEVGGRLDKIHVSKASNYHKILFQRVLTQ